MKWLNCSIESNTIVNINLCQGGRFCDRRRLCLFASKTTQNEFSQAKGLIILC